MSNVIITGANRGIGLELSKTFMESGSTVYGCCRKPKMTPMPRVNVPLTNSSSCSILCRRTFGGALLLRGGRHSVRARFSGGVRLQALQTRPVREELRF